jgi:hypothetical protein
VDVPPSLAIKINGENMPETLDTAVDSLSDYTRRFEIATFYTNGDAERAKQMIAGAFKDIYVIKGKFNTTTSGSSKARSTWLFRSSSRASLKSSLKGEMR